MANRWNMPGGYRDVLAVSLPLVASMASTTVMEFTDRVFLAGYSVEAIAAATPANVASFTFMALFLGAVGFTNVFIAQYVGSKAPHRVGAALWQGLWFCAGAGLFMWGLSLAGGPLFGLVGHAPEVGRLEAVYFSILCRGTVLGLVAQALSCFFSGRGLTRPVMLAHVAGAVVNIPLDYCLINGVGPFPEMGIAGAGWATVVGWAVPCAVLAPLVFSRAHEREFRVRSSWMPERGLLARLCRFGLPGGAQLALDIFTFAFFVFMVGRLGKGELAVSNMALSLNSLAFLPIVGFHTGVSTLVGQAVGGNRPDLAVAATRSTIQLTFLWMGLVSASFVLLPGPFLEFFRSRGLPDEQWLPMLASGTVLLRFVAVYCLMDGVMLVYSGALKGAGDTVFLLWTTAAASLGLVIAPVWAAMEWFGAGLYVCWTFVVLFIFALGSAYWNRFRQGRWRHINVVETSPGR